MKFKKVIEGMRASRDCLGFREHKVLTVNTVYGYEIEGDEITLAMRRLKDFAEACFEAGWHQATAVIENQMEETKA